MSSVPTRRAPRDRTDRCPGVLRPWLAEDGALVRIRLVGGVLGRSQLAGLAALAAEHGDGTVHLTTRANLQVRGLANPVPRRFVETVTALGLLPAPTHERVRNIVVSPLTGRLGGAADLRTTARLLDEGLCADPALAALPARFLFCLDDRGDLHDRPCDLAAVAVDQGRARLVAGGLGGEVVDLEDVPRLLLGLARRFVELRGTGLTAPWHVSELPARGGELGPFHPAAHPAAHPPAHPPAHPAGAPAPVAAPPYGRLVQDDGRALLHAPVPDGVLTPSLLEQVLASAADTVVVTPWRSLVLPDLEVAA